METDKLSEILSKFDFGIEDICLEFNTGKLTIVAVNEPKTLLAMCETAFKDMPDSILGISDYSRLKNILSTFAGSNIKLLKDKNVLVFRGINTKHLPLVELDLVKSYNKNVVSKFEKETKDVIPIQIPKDMLNIIRKDVGVFGGTEIDILNTRFEIKNNVLTITFQNETGVTSETKIEKVDLEDGNYLFPPLFHKMLSLCGDTVKIFFVKGFLYIKDVEEGFITKYLLCPIEKMDESETEKKPESGTEEGVKDETN